MKAVEQMALRTFFPLIIFLAFSPPGARAETLASPEQEVDGALARLEELAKLLRSVEQLSTVTQMNPQLYQVKNSLEAGRRYFDNREYLAATREFYFFLSVSPATNSNAYLEVQKKLGEANENLKMLSRAKTHYHNFLAAFLTHSQQNYDDFVGVLKRLLVLVAKGDATDQKRIKALLAAITSMALPENMKHEVYYLAAKTAFLVGLPTAQQWLANSAEFADDAKIRARSLYFSGLIAMQLQDWDRAKRIFLEALKRNHDGPAQINDWCNLALAKIDAHIGRFDASQDSYQKIPESSPYYKEALYEGVFLNLAAKNFGHARTDAAVFVSSNRNDQRALLLHSFTPYFDLLAGDGPAGNQGILSATASLDKLAEELALKRGSEIPLNRAELTRLANATQAELDHPTLVVSGLRRFRQIDEQNLAVATLKNEIRDVIFTLGRTSLLNLNPDWLNRSRFLEKTARDLLEVGHRLAGTERSLYFDSLSEPQRLKLVSSEQLRIAIVKRNDAETVNTSLWEYFTAYAQVIRNYADSYQRLLELRADLASIRLLGDQISLLSHEKREILDVRRVIADLLETVEANVQDLRLENVAQLSSESPNLRLGAMLRGYTAALREETSILSEQRLLRTSVSEQIQVKKVILAWERWDYMLSKLFEQQKRLEDEVTKGFTELVTSLKQAYFAYATLALKLGTMRTELTKAMTRAKPMIVDQYQTQIRRRLARNQKWLADIQWAKGDHAEGKLGQLSTEMLVERQTLEQRLNAIEQGVLLEWPN